MAGAMAAARAAARVAVPVAAEEQLAAGSRRQSNKNFSPKGGRTTRLSNKNLNTNSLSQQTGSTQAIRTVVVDVLLRWNRDI